VSTFFTTVEGSTLAEIEKAADAEVSRFFAGYSLHDSEAGVMREPVLDIRPHTFVRGDAGVSITYQAEVTVTW
jgi:hypothetical protein